jgi:DNA invertase Pin-like site-specific DNA recombinase
MLIGYARVSRGDHQDLQRQLTTLTATGCETVFCEEASGGRNDRSELACALAALGSGDVLVVWKLDRLSRSLSDLLFTLKRIEDAGAGFRSLTEAIDTTTVPGRLMAQMLGAFAEFEREMISERTRHGLAHARQAGRHIGRKPSLTAAQRAKIVAEIEAGTGSTASMATLFRVSKATVKRVMAAHRQQNEPA